MRIKIILLYVFWGLSINTLYPVIVYTCRGGSVSALENSEFTPDQIASGNAQLLSQYSYLGISSSDIIANTSNQYNCHAYAWHLTEGNTNKVWINNTTGQQNGGCYVSSNNLNVYWEETYGCFTHTFVESEAVKIHYYCGDHSAVKSSVAGKYESKWGQFPVVRHSPNSVPYTSPGNRRYYKRRYIIGPTMVCTSGATFTAINVSSGYTWSHSSNLNAPSISGNTATFTAKSGNFDNGLGWIAINEGSTEVERKEVWVGKPVLSDITGPTGISNTQSATYQAIYNSLANPSSFQWILSPLGNASAIPENQYFDVGIGTPGSYQVVCRATNACGQGEYFVIDVNVYHSYGNYSSAYPNPVSGILNIDVNRETEALQKKSVASAGCEFALDIRLYDSRGNLQRQATSKGEKVVFNVSNLPNGLYILHVYDGIQENPEIHKIIVKH